MAAGAAQALNTWSQARRRAPSLCARDRLGERRRRYADRPNEAAQGTMMRNPSCSTSCSQLGPTGGRSTSVGSHGRTNPGAAGYAANGTLRRATLRFFIAFGGVLFKCLPST